MFFQSIGRSVRKAIPGGLRRAGLVLALSVAVAAPAASAGDGSGLSQIIAETIAALQASGQKTQAAIMQIEAQTEAALGKIIGQSGGSLGGALQETIDNLSLVLQEANSSYLAPTTGTTSFSANITVGGTVRTYYVVRPQPATQNAPMLILMHAHGITPQTMANLARAGRLAQDYGVWVFLPEGENQTWNEDPSSSSKVDDVGFISAMIDAAVSQYGIDQKRVYAAGYSAGGFMAERLGCQLSQKIAGFVAVSATLRDSLDTASECTPTHAMPVAFMDGTSDFVVPYKGEPTLQSAAAATAFWAVQNACVANQSSTTTLPQLVKDGTTVALTEFTQCPTGAAAALYTINGGGHTWPDSPDSLYTAYLGTTTQNLDATIALWQFLTPYSLP